MPTHIIPQHIFLSAEIFKSTALLPVLLKSSALIEQGEEYESEGIKLKKWRHTTLVIPILGLSQVVWDCLFMFLFLFLIYFLTLRP